MNTQESQSVFPQFYIKAVENKKESLEQNRTICFDREYVKIYVAGDKSNIPDVPVNEQHKKRWPEQYAAFKAGNELALNGTPVEEWSVLSASKIAELKALNVRTVEALAEINDGFIHKLGMGGRDLVKRAQKFLEVSKEQGGLNKIIQQNAQLEAEVEMLKKRLSEVSNG